MFSDIHTFFKKVIEEIETKGKADLDALSADVKTTFESEKNTILAQIAQSSPDIQAAVKQTLVMLEQALVAALAVHGL